MLKRNMCAAALLLPLLGGLFCGTKMMVGFALLQRGTEIDPLNFGKEQLDELVQNGEFIGALKYYNGENNNQEAQFATSTQGEREAKEFRELKDGLLFLTNPTASKMNCKN